MRLFSTLPKTLEKLLILFRNPEFHLKTKKVQARFWRKEAKAVLDMTRFSMFLSYGSEIAFPLYSLNVMKKGRTLVLLVREP